MAGSHPTTTGPAGGTTSVVQEEASTSDDAYASPDSHAFWCGAGGPGALEGVHPGLATYESQRAALMPGRGFVAGAEDGAARAREYSLMLGQMQVRLVSDSVEETYENVSLYCRCGAEVVDVTCAYGSSARFGSDLCSCWWLKQLIFLVPTAEYDAFLCPLLMPVAACVDAFSMFSGGARARC